MTLKTRSEHLNLRCYIEGELVPIIATTVSHGQYAASTATVQLVGTDEAMQLRPRSTVEIYHFANGPRRKLADVGNSPFYSYLADGSIDKVIKPVSPGFYDAAFPTIPLAELEEELQYDLIFIGEVAGYSFYSDSQQRVVTLMCVDFSNHLDSLNQFTIDLFHPSTVSPTTRMALLSGYHAGINSGKATLQGLESNVEGFDVKIDVTTTGAAGEGTNTPSNHSLSTIAGGALGLEQRLAGILGTKQLRDGVKDIFTNLAKSYIFYRDVDEELNLRDMFQILDDDKISSTYQKYAVQQIVYGYQNQYGSVNSFKNLLKIVFRVTHFEFTPVPGHPFYSVGKFDPTLLRTVPGFDIQALKLQLIKPELYFAEPPACNTIFPDEIYSINASRSFLSEPTRGIESTDPQVADPKLNNGVDGIMRIIALAPSIIVGEDNVIKSYASPQMVTLFNNLRKGVEAFGETLLGDEILKGILPVSSYTPHYLRSAYLGLAKSGNVAGDFSVKVDETGSTSFTPGAPGVYKFIVDEANYKFLVSKFENRTAQLSCKFLPRLIPGFTSFFTDRATVRALSQESDSLGFIGHIVQVQHSISQAGAVTSVTLSHVRPTNEQVDFAAEDGKGGAGAVRILPDFREMGTMPWAREKYGPDVIHRTYAEWLGGLDWRGHEVEIGNKEHLGIDTLSRAIVSESSGVVTAGLLALKVAYGPAGSGGTVLATSATFLAKFLKILRELMMAYRSEVASKDGSGTKTIEEFASKLVARPMANRLQVRGYFNAYTSDNKVSSGVEKTKSRQRFLVETGFLDAKGVDGIWGDDSKKALGKFQADYNKKYKNITGPVFTVSLLAETGVWDTRTQRAVEETVATDFTNPLRGRQILSELGSQVNLDAAVPSGDSITTNRRFRRGVRLRAVVEYLESLQSAGTKSKGLQG